MTTEAINIPVVVGPEAFPGEVWVQFEHDGSRVTVLTQRDALSPEGALRAHVLTRRGCMVFVEFVGQGFWGSRMWIDPSKLSRRGATERRHLKLIP